MAPKTRRSPYGVPGGGSPFALVARLQHEQMLRQVTAPPPQPTPVTKRKSDKMATALDVAADPARRAQALANLRRDKFAQSGVSARETWFTTWNKFHHALFGEDVHPMPLDQPRLEGIISLFKAASYRSVANYVQRAKSEHGTLDD